MKFEQPTITENKPEQENYRQQAIDFLYETLDMPSGNIEDFPEKLNQAIEELPRYKEILKEVKDLPPEQIPVEVFKRISYKADPEGWENSKDGVLLPSMREGHLHCAGRTMIASRIFSNLNIPHAKISPPGHSMLILEPAEDTIAFFDGNADLYFTAPKEALVGYKGLSEFSECELTPFKQRENDFHIGEGGTYNYYTVELPQKGILRSYLGNAASALHQNQDGSGQPEFDNSGYIKNDKLSEVIADMREELLGEYYTTYDSRRKYRRQKYDAMENNNHAFIINTYKQSQSEQEFIDQILPELRSGDLWIMAPFYKTDEERTERIKKVYDKLKKGDLLEPTHHEEQ